MKLRWKIILGILLITVLCNGAFTAYLLHNQRQKQMNRLEDKIQRTNNMLQVLNTEPLWDMDQVKLQQNLHTFFQKPEVYSIHLRDVTGSINIQYQKDKTHSEYKLIKHNLPIQKDNYKLGQIEITYTTSKLEKALNQRKMEMIGLTLGLVTILGVVFFVFSRRSLKPIDYIVNAMDSVDMGNFDTSLDLKTRDEFEQIEKYFNKMTKTIRQEIESRKTKERELAQSEARFRSIFQIVGVSIWEIDFPRFKKEIDALDKQSGEGLSKNLEANPGILQEVLQELVVLNVNEETLRMFEANNLQELKNNLDSIFTSDALSVSRELILEINQGEKQMEHTTSLNTLRGNKIEVILKMDLSEIVKEQTICLLTMMDITQRREMERNLIQMQKMETVGTLAGGIAHDFNNILSGITGYVSMIQREARNENINPDKILKFAEQIEKATNKSEAMIKNLLALSRNYQSSQIVVDLNTSVQNVVSVAESSIPDQIELVVEYFPEQALTEVDPIMIEQILLNFLINAIHAMTIMRPQDESKHGTLSCKIDKIFADKHFCDTHSDAQAIHYWILRVSDTGVGMDQKTRSKMFEPFYTTKDKNHGTGLGLAMAYNFIRDSKGLIDIYSSPGSGTVINLFLPVSEKSSMDQASEGQEEAYHTGSGLILLVEDDELIRNSVSGFLTECGYQVLEADNGSQAVEYFQQKQGEIRLTILDMLMPSMSGDEAFREIKGMDPQARILLTSGFSQDPRVQSLLDSGVDDFLQKPFSMQDLTAKLQKLLKQ